MPEFLLEWLKTLDAEQLNELASWAMGDSFYEEIGSVLFERGYRYSEQQEKWVSEGW